MKTIDLVYFNAGGGHRAAALALQQAITQQGRPWQVRLVDLNRVLDPQSSFRRMLGFDPEQFYNLRLQRGWTLGLAQELKVLQAAIRLAHTALMKPLVRHWAHTEPVEPDQDQWLICGSDRAVQQARAAGYADSRIAQTSGMVIKPSFYVPDATPREAARMAHGLHPQAPTAVVMFGGQGSRQMLRVARLLDGVQLVLLCGHNHALKERLSTMTRSAPHVALGFHDQVAPLMRLGDFFIGKPGPGCLSEAVRLGLPVITLRNAWTMPQER